MSETSEHDNEATAPKHSPFIRWRHTTVGRICWAVLAGIITYLFASLAVNSGALWQWAIALIFAIDCVYNLVRFGGNLIHGHDH